MRPRRLRGVNARALLRASAIETWITAPTSIRTGDRLPPPRSRVDASGGLARIAGWWPVYLITAVVSGRTPRHQAKASAACSTSMPTPSASCVTPAACACLRKVVSPLP